MYSDKQNLVRNSLWNFMGNLLESSIYEENNKKKESVTALVSEELCKFCTDEEDHIDLTASKPLIKSTIWILKKRLEEVQLTIECSADEFYTKKLTDYMKELNSMIETLEAFINKI